MEIEARQARRCEVVQAVPPSLKERFWGGGWSVGVPDLVDIAAWTVGRSASLTTIFGWQSHSTQTERHLVTIFDKADVPTLQSRSVNASSDRPPKP